MKRNLFPITLSLIIFMICSAFAPYPFDGYETTGIKRLKRLELIMNGTIPEAKPPLGGQKSICDIKLNLENEKGDSLATLPKEDPNLQKAINGLFPNMNENYSITVLDITPGKSIKYASRKEKNQYQPGSVGKIAVATAMFNELCRILPDNFEERQALLRTKTVRGGKWAMVDSHTVPFFDITTNKLTKRTVVESDVFSLYEWLDHMFSVSNNGAASVCWRETVLMRAFGTDYLTLTEEDANAYFANTPKSELSQLANDLVNDPLRELGISEDEWRLGAFFTKGAGSFIPAKGGSTGTTLGLMKYLVAMERGKVIDQESSLEIKRMMYMTDRRIRYAAAGSLSKAAVYFKSGSLYKCKAEEGYVCEKYKGNIDNFMNSVAIVEHTNGNTYLVVLMSNVLKKNSGTDHAILANSIDRILNVNPVISQ